MTDQLINELSTDSINRVGFPLCKVFIYGQEVTPDIISVRVNQAGGSTERTPGTCTIAIANPKDKYILHHQDIVSIAKKKGWLSGSWSDFDSTHMTSDYTNPNLGVLSEETNVNNLKLAGGSLDLPGIVLDELAARLSEASDDELHVIIQSVLLENLDGGTAVDISLSEAQALSKLIIANRQSTSSQAVDAGLPTDAWEGLDLTYKVKQEVVTQKLEYTQTLKSDEANAYSSDLLVQEDRLIYDYPMSEGDCVFNLNDPVRVAFRDPFDPRIWYWMFTGFVDTWTDDAGTNFDSIISINCTDVTKMARYSLAEIKTGLLDANIESIINGVTTEDKKVADTGVPAANEIFSYLSIPEILEIIFFGSDSAKTLVANSGLAMAETVDDLLADNLFETLSAEEWESKFMAQFNFSREEVQSFMPSADILVDVSASGGYSVGDISDISWSTIKNKVADAYTVQSLKRINPLSWYGISSPRDVSFKRSSPGRGLHIYVYGEPSAADNAYGATPLKDLFTLNEEIHHRVRESDLKVMSAASSNEYDTLYEINQSVTFESPNAIEKVISKIGTDLTNYPVGHGRVIYVAPAKMDSISGESILDRGMGGVGSMHSVFKDRLTYLYDLADIVEWRFYASPRGDVLFEMPFYDFEPDAFFESSQQSEDLGDTYKDKTFIYESTFGEQYAGDYDENADDLTTMAMDLNATESDIDFTTTPVFDYRSHFTIEIHEQSGYSNTNTDKGIITVYRAKDNIVASLEQVNNNEDIKKFYYAPDKALIPTLGFRIEQGNLWSFAQGASAAEMYSALQLNKLNSSARNIGLPTLPKFGLMVNRPLYWVYRNYYANIVSLNHSLVWNSDVNTSINLNQVRAWSGAVDDKNKPIYRHFGDSNRPFNMVEMLSKAKSKDNQNSGV